MASITVASNSIVLEVLNQHNYKEWSSRVETYLLAEDLWDVVNMKPPEREEREVEYEAWKTKNAKALHAIKISCGTRPFSFINETRTAKMAWEVLEKQFKSCETLRLEQKGCTHHRPIEREERNRYLYTKIDDARQELTPADEEGGNQNSSNYHFDSSYEPFFDSVVKGDWDNAKECLATLLIPNVLRARNPAARGSTALHIAVREGHVHIVKELMLLMTQEDLEIRDDNGCTALHIAVQKENVDAVKEVVPLMRQQGLGIKNKNYGETALHVAAGSGNVRIAKELGEFMREDDLEIGNSNNCHALHRALLKGHVQIGKELVALMRKEDLEMNDGQGYTALGRAIRLCHQRGDEYSEGAVIEMIKPMVAKNQKMLGIVASPNDYIPVVEACMLLKIQVGRYLYSVTPREDLMPPKNRRQGASLFVFCLGAKEFDIPWDLLSNCPRLATVETVHGGNSPILVLSRMHSAFLSGMQLKFWQKWIYERLGERRLRSLCTFLHHRWSTIPLPPSVLVFSCKAPVMPCIGSWFTSRPMESSPVQIHSDCVLSQWEEAMVVLLSRIRSALRVKHLRPSQARLKSSACGFGLVAVWLRERFESSWSSWERLLSIFLQSDHGDDPIIEGEQTSALGPDWLCVPAGEGGGRGRCVDATGMILLRPRVVEQRSGSKSGMAWVLRELQ